MRRLLITIASVFAAAVPAAAQAVAFQGPASVRLYERADFSVTTESVPGNPYLQEEAALDMVLTSPSGRQVVLPCFWVEGTRWEARFTPQEKGRYSFVFRYLEAGKEEAVSSEGNLCVKSGRSHGILHADGNWILRYDDGTPFRGVGENICWESRDRDDSKFFRELHERSDLFSYDVMLPRFAAEGGNFCRMWMCSWNFPIDRHDRFNNRRYEPSDEYYNPSAVKHLDDVLALAESLGIRIMLCMGPGDVPTGRDFFVSDDAKARYRNRLRYIVARWGYSPSVAMWEFFNEIDNIQFRDSGNPIPAADIVQWHTEMASFLKGLDPYGHIVTTSISHRDLKGLNDIPGIDVNQKHIYRATSSIPGTIASYEAAHGKPYVIGEFSYEWDWSKNFDDFASDMDNDFRRGLWYGIFSPTPVTPMSWWWEYFENRGMLGYFKGVRKVSDLMLSCGDGSFESVVAEAPGAEAFAVKCGRCIFVYVYNPGPGNLGSVSVEAGDGCRLRAFDFTAAAFGKASKVKAADGTVCIPVSLGPKEEALFELR